MLVTWYTPENGARGWGGGRSAGRRKVTIGPRAPVPGGWGDEKSFLPRWSRPAGLARGDRLQTVHPHLTQAARRAPAPRAPPQPPPHCLHRPGVALRAGWQAGRRAGAPRVPPRLGPAPSAPGPRPDLARDSPPSVQLPRALAAAGRAEEGAADAGAADWPDPLIGRWGNHSQPQTPQRLRSLGLGSARVCSARLVCSAADRLTGVRWRRGARGARRGPLRRRRRKPSAPARPVLSQRRRQCRGPLRSGARGRRRGEERGRGASAALRAPPTRLSRRTDGRGPTRPLPAAAAAARPPGAPTRRRQARER